MVLYDEIQDYPFLNQEEFMLSCHYLDQKYVAATLGNERQAFRLRLHSSLLTGQNFISIARPIDLSRNELDLSLDLKVLSWEEEDLTTDAMVIDAENADTEALTRDARDNTGGELPRYSVQADQPYVVYEIHLHPTYRTPVLWFSLRDLPPCDSPYDIETIYRYVVPDQFKDQLRSIGVIGGISAGYHPVTDVPAFFVHPCTTKEAMDPFNCTLKDYLTIWLGLVGPSVGLWLPSAVAQCTA